MVLKPQDIVNLASNLEMRIVTAPYFIAIRLEAFKSRGRGDFLGSRYLEDVITVIDGRGSLVKEIRAEPAELRQYIREEITRLMQSSRFVDALSGFLLPDVASQARLSMLLGRLRELATN